MKKEKLSIMSDLVEYAKSELERFPKDKDGMQNLMSRNILDLIKVFASQGHTGFSAHYLIPRLKRLMDFKPLSALTGKDDEWNEVCRTDNPRTYQNKRCCSVFKDVYADGTVRVHDLEAVAISDNGGVTWFTSAICNQFEDPITFPYFPPDEPKEVYIEYKGTGDSEDFDVITDEPERIRALRERYLRDRGDLV
jgi:hypothetical protein